MRSWVEKLIARIADEQIGNAYAQGYALGYKHGRNETAKKERK